MRWTALLELPLALKVLGALLFGKPECYWEAKLNESKVLVKVSPDIKNRLKISYDALSEQEQMIFLDITFFFIGESKTSAIAVWDASGWNGLLRLTDLEGKCLVEVDDKNVIHMHDQLRDMGRQIAEEETPRRLWRLTGNIDDWLHNYSSVLSKARGIWLLPGGHSTKPVGTSSKVLGKRKRYRFLGCDVMNFQLVETEGHLLDRILRVHSPNLSWLSWRHCPYTCLPSWINIENLRVLKLKGAVLRTLWQDIPQAPLQLQELDLSWCGRLERLPDSFGSLSNLHSVDLCLCQNLERLPDSFGSLSNLHSLDLSACYKLERLPDSFGSLSNLHSLALGWCKKLERLPDSFGSLRSLGYFNASCCANLTISSEAFGNIRTLEHIDLSGCEKVQVWPWQLGHRMSLKVVKLTGTNLKNELLDRVIAELPSDLEVLWIGHPLLETVMPSLGHLRKLKELLLQCINLRSIEGLCDLPILEVLRIKECDELEELVETMVSLKELSAVHCAKLKSIRDLAQLTKLEHLKVHGCAQLGELNGVEYCTSLRYLSVIGSPKLQWDERVVETLRQQCGPQFWRLT